MEIKKIIENWLNQNPGLALSQGDQILLETSSVLQNLEPQDFLLKHNDSCAYLPFVLKGRIKVSKISPEGREVVLYHISQGESCILSALGILNNTPYPAGAQCEQRAQIILMPKALVSRFVNQYQGWRDFIFSLYNSRFHKLMEFVDQVAFQRLDQRLAQYLSKQADGALRTTHQEVADQLGTSREVISRLLKDMEHKDCLRLKRGVIEDISKENLKKKYLV